MPENSSAENSIAVVGRSRELAALSTALASRQSRLTVGAAGIGKTRFLQESLAVRGQPFVALARPAVLHDLLVQLAGLPGCGSSLGSGLQHATTIHLKPLVLDSLREHPRCVAAAAVLRLR